MHFLGVKVQHLLYLESNILQKPINNLLFITFFMKPDISY